MKPLLAIAALCALLFAAAQPAAAATVSEGDVAGGSFSGSYNDPTEIAPGVTTVTGTGSQNVFDFLVFTGLPAGAQTITFTFSPPEDYGYSYSAGGKLFVSTSPFNGLWSGTDLGMFDVRYHQPSDSITIEFDDSFTGTLYVGLHFTHGKDLQYAITTDASYEDAPVVPVPGAGVLMLTGLAGVGALQWRRRRS